MYKSNHNCLAWPRLVTVFFLCPGAVSVLAEEDPATETAFERAWSHATLWDSTASDSYLALSGRLQLDAYWFGADKGDVPPGADDDDKDVRWRRFRFGFKSEFGGAYTVQLEADFDLNNNPDDLYNRLTDAYVGYSPGETWEIKVLKQSAAYTLDGATSSKKLLTLQRNNLTNNLWATDEYFSGVQLSGGLDQQWIYRAGVFSGDDSEEIGFDDVGYFTLLSLGHDLAHTLEMDEALVRIDYVYNSKDDDDLTDDDDDYENNATPDFRHTTTLATHWQSGPWGLRTDVSVGQGLDRQSDIWGLVLMPLYSFSEQRQIVLRYTYIDSSDDNGISLGRYEREIVSGRGDSYNEFYAGFNVYIYGQKLKWQTGLQYTKMDDAADDGGDYSGWGLTTGMRMYW